MRQTRENQKSENIPESLKTTPGPNGAQIRISDLVTGQKKPPLKKRSILNQYWSGKDSSKSGSFGHMECVVRQLSPG